MIIVTAGSKYIDIDAYAGIIAYAHLLNLKRIQAKAVSTAALNKSITGRLLQLQTGLDKVQTNPEDEFVIVDVSNKDYFDTIVKEDKIVGIIDHHVGFEEYWKEKLGKEARIEFIGSVATIIVELYEQENLINQIPKEIAILLMSAILDNTLNFKAKVTTKRDKDVYEKLESIAGGETDYAQKYFLECQTSIEENLKESIENDTKREKINDILPAVFSQMTIWDKDNILKNKEMICDTLNQMGNEWMLNMICLKDGKSYIIAKNPVVQEKLQKLLNGKFDNDVMPLSHVWLRKEIIKKSKEKYLLS